MSVKCKIQSVEGLLEQLVEQAIERDVPRSIAEEAGRTTARGVRSPVGPITPQTERRLEAYFAAVVRRRSVRRDAPRGAAAHFVLASVVHDLRSTGRSERDIWDELERGWAAQVPREVLEEYRLRLCG